MPFLKIAKNIVLAGAKRAGVFNLVRNTQWRTQRLLILAYHGVSLHDEHRWNGCLYMPEELVRHRFEVLRRGSYNVLSLSEAVERLFRGDLPMRAVVLTFDDGSYDFIAKALPLLNEFRYPATVYLTTYYSRMQYPVFDNFSSYLLWKAEGKCVDFTHILRGHGRMTLHTAKERMAAAKQLRREAAEAKLSAEAKNDIARRLAIEAGVDFDYLCERRFFHIMTPAEVAEIVRMNVSVQLHTHRHRTPRHEQLFRREISDNRMQIASITGSNNIEHFCYPNGNYVREFLLWLHAEGVRTATTSDPGLSTRNTHPLLLPRIIDTCNVTPTEFEGWLTGVSAFLPTRSIVKDNIDG